MALNPFCDPFKTSWDEWDSLVWLMHALGGNIVETSFDRKGVTVCSQTAKQWSGLLEHALDNHWVHVDSIGKLTVSPLASRLSTADEATLERFLYFLKVSQGFRQW